MYVNVSLCECMQVSTEARSSVTFGTGIKVCCELPDSHKPSLWDDFCRNPSHGGFVQSMVGA